MRQTPCLAGYASTFPERTNSQNGLLWHSIGLSWCSSGSVLTGQKSFTEAHRTKAPVKVSIRKTYSKTKVFLRMVRISVYSVHQVPKQEHRSTKYGTCFARLSNVMEAFLVADANVNSNPRIELCVLRRMSLFENVGNLPPTQLWGSGNDSVPVLWNCCSPSFHEICAGRTSIECGSFVGSSDLGYLTNSNDRNTIGRNSKQLNTLHNSWHSCRFGCHDDAMAPWPGSRWVSL